MIRLLFAMFVTLAGFAAAALWVARGGDPREVVDEIVPADVRSEVLSQVRSAADRLDLGGVAPRPPEAPSPRLSEPIPKGEAPRAAAVAGDAAEPEAIAVPETEVAEIPETEPEARDLSPRGEFAPDLGPLSGDTDAGEMATAVAASARSSRGDGAAPREPDPDEWASLIRRMLALYQRTRAVE